MKVVKKESKRRTYYIDANSMTPKEQVVLMNKLKRIIKERKSYE
jgi:hypothetical protein